MCDDASQGQYTVGLRENKKGDVVIGTIKMKPLTIREDTAFVSREMCPFAIVIAMWGCGCI